MKFLTKTKKKLNNQGSSIVMVIVSLAFIGIIVGSLLAAAGASYRLKLREVNAKDNFYYVEQAMQEIYTGIGMQTIEEMKSAYSYTLENMVYYDPEQGTYVSLSDEDASDLFKKKFMENIMESEYFKKGSLELAQSLQGYISNDSVVLDVSKLSIVREADRIIIKDVTLCRTQDYGASASGTYTQTVSADIVISEPDFNLNFNSVNADYSTIFDYAMIADMGIEIKQEANKNLVINGNIYAASDYYNKSYNNGTLMQEKDTKYKDGNPSGTLNYDGDVIKNDSYEYSFGSVSNKIMYSDEEAKVYELDPKKGYVNDFAKDPDTNELTYAKMNGEEQHSRYSGLYIDGSDVSIMTDNIVVPGTIAVMNNSNLVVYGKATGTTLPQIWTDDIVLGGTSKKDGEAFVGSSATFKANLFVKDDTEINADGSTFAVNGSYYGYGDSTSKDTREFTEMVDTSKFQISTLNSDGSTSTYNRGHFNSSAIVVNGQGANLDFSHLENLYVAGRSYVELSRYGVSTTDSNTVKTTTYTYNPYTNSEKTDYIRDYKTGESISYKTSQLLYTVSNFDAASATLKLGYEAVVIPETLKGDASFFGTYFPNAIFNGYLPVSRQIIRGRQYVFIDFNKAWSMIKDAETNGSTDAKAAALNLTSETGSYKYGSVDDYIKGYAVAYASEMQKDDASPLLSDITKIDDFTLGDLKYSSNDATVDFEGNVYSSGAISVYKNNTFKMTVLDDESVLSGLLSDPVYATYGANMGTVTTAPDNIVTAAYNMSNDLETEYNFMKWNLAHYNTTDNEQIYVKDVVANYGEDALTPINKYLIIKNLSKKPTTDYKLTGYELSSGTLKYQLWASDSDVLVDGTGDLSGIIITSGDVSFSDNVTGFTGMIIAGGKIYVGKNMTSIVAAPATCREILRQCLRTDDQACKYFLDLFREYEGMTTGEGTNIDDPNAENKEALVDLESLGISDVVSMENWMNSIGGAYDVAD